MALRESRIASTGDAYSCPRRRSTSGRWLTPRPRTKRFAYAAFRVLAALWAATASRAQMLAMPVAMTIEDVALSISPAFVKASRPHASGSHIAAYPSDSSSLATRELPCDLESALWGIVSKVARLQLARSRVGVVLVAPSYGERQVHAVTDLGSVVITGPPGELL